MDSLLHAPCGYFAFGDDRIIREVNVEGARMLAAEREQLLGRAVSEIFTTRTRVFFTAHVYPALALHGAVHETYVSLLKTDGDELATLMNIVRRKLDSGWLNESVFMAMQRRRLFEKDLIEQRRAALSAAHAEQAALEQLKAAQLQLAAQDQLASLGMLAAGVAHEINNPLSYVAGNLELLHKRLQDRFDDGELHGMLKEATHGVDRIRDIVRSLRTLSRMEEAEHRMPVDLREVVQVAARLAGNQLRHHSELEISVPEQPLVVEGDAGRLGQVVLNLLVNASQAMPVRRSQNLIRLSIRPEHGDAIIEVEDNGPGIAEADLSHIFDPFFTTKPVGLGTGLGLSVCKGIVSSLGGTITVESSGGAGACFRVALPLQAAEPAARVRAAQASERPAAATHEAPHARARPSVLLIDDDQHVTRMIARALRAFDVTVINRSQDALSALAANSFDVILCDLMMPNVTGIDIHRELSRSNPAQAQRMIFLTGGSFSAEADDFLSRAENPCIQKPFPTEALQEACREMAHKHSGVHA
jgi:signal transduction histidine kinase/ActR/RegA family two-component response regulator